MNKTIRDRIIFAVVACAAIIGIILYYNAQPKPVHLPQDLREMMGEEADASFSNYFTALHDWYEKQEVTADGVIFDSQEDFNGMTDVLASLLPFLIVYEQELSAEQFAQAQEALSPMLNFTIAYLSMLETMSTTGTYQFTLEDWTALGSTIQSMTDYYRLA